MNQININMIKPSFASRYSEDPSTHIAVEKALNKRFGALEGLSRLSRISANNTLQGEMEQ